MPTPKDIPVRDLIPNERNIRKAIDPNHLARLVASVGKSGVINPLSVRAVGQHYRVIAGDTRLEAAKQAGLETVPCRVYDEMEPSDELAINLTEQLCKLDPNPIELANGWKRMMKETGLTAKQLADLHGWDASTMCRDMALLTLPPETQELIARGEMAKSEGYRMVKKTRRTTAEKMKRAAFKVGGAVLTFAAKADDFTADKFLAALEAAKKKAQAHKDKDLSRVAKLAALEA